MLNRFQAKHPFIRRIQTIFICLAGLSVTGLVVRPIEAPVWQTVKSGQPELNLGELEGAVGQGVLIGVLGGFRAIFADLLWIQTNHYWQQKDQPKTETMIQLVTQLDPRPDFFWINGARMTAYDIPNWRIRALGGYQTVPKSVQNEIDYEQAMRGIELIQRAREFHPKNPRMVLEIAQIYNNRLKDTENAAKWFGKAAAMEGAPHFAARIHAELLRRLDRTEEAYQYLKAHHADLPDPESIAAQIALERIRDMEDELRVPALRRYLPTRTYRTLEFF